MDTLPLPPHPNLQQYKKRAKDLVTASTSPRSGAIRVWAAEWLATLARLRGIAITPFVEGSFNRAIEVLEARVAGAPLALTEAQLLIARAHGFASWPKFANHVEGISRKGGDVHEFEAAADAVVGGHLPALESLVHRKRGLIHARSTRAHRGTLLHYVAANGVEDFRQVTPPNAVAIARFLLEAGAEADAWAQTYGGGSDQTTMNLLVSSVHPAKAGLQGALVETLLDGGAAINGVEDDGSPLMTALSFGYGAAAATLARRGARVDNVVPAAALGRLDLVQSLIVAGDDVQRSIRVPADPKARAELALVWACAYGQMAVVAFLLEQGVDPGATDTDAMTGLHWAAANRHLDIVKLLLECGAPLEAKNAWGGTVLDSTGWFVGHGVWFPVTQPVGEPPGPAVEYATVIETLISAGADLSPMHYATGNRLVDEVLERYRTSWQRRS